MNWDCGKNEYNTSLTKASLLQEAITLKTKNEIRGIAAMNKITRYGINASNTNIQYSSTSYCSDTIWIQFSLTFHRL